jgi:D-alanyl-D-alanine carboxypeptidase (penicillin-binding protein 5/6)
MVRVRSIPQRIAASIFLSAVLLAAIQPQASVAGMKSDAQAALIGAESILIVDGDTGKVLLEKAANRPREIASVQKLLSAMIIVEAGDLDKPVTVTAADASCQPTKLPNAVGGTYTRRELLAAMLVLSANDAARALARDNAGSESAFGAKMTLMARRLGAKTSVFKNSAGFSAGGQYSTASDTMKIAMAAYRNPVIRDIMATKDLAWRDADGRPTSLRNSNRMLQRHPNCRGLKVGYTAAAGHCTAALWEEKGRRVFAVVLHGHKEMFWLQLAVVMKLHANGLL